MKKPLRLNLGSGSSRIDGFVNIDVEPSCKPDLVCDFTKDKLPYTKGSVDEVCFFHCIEHISKHRHKAILTEIHRVLKDRGSFIISYPEFTRCVENWKTNFRGKKEFWEATIYGRQLYQSDYHVAIMHTPDFLDLLKDVGFSIVDSHPEPGETYNSVVYATKIIKPLNYEDLIGRHKEKVKHVKVGK